LVERAREIRIDHVAPLVLFHAPERTVARDARVVDEDVQVAERVERLVHERLRLRGVANVVLATECIDLELPHLPERFFRVPPAVARAVVAVVERDVHPMARQLEDDRAADATRAAGHDRAVPTQVRVQSPRLRACLLANLGDQLLDGIPVMAVGDAYATPSGLRGSLVHAVIPGVAMPPRDT